MIAPIISYSLKNKITLITGASRGIGRSTALLFAKHGSDLILISREMNRLNFLRDEIKFLYPVDVLTFECDVRNKQDIDAIISHSLDHFNKIDIVICNAGMGQYGPVSQSKWEHLTEILQVNIEGSFAVAHSVLPHMIQRKSGSIIFISSVLGKHAVQYNAVYSASKYAIHGFADALRLEAKQCGIHVGVVCPARTDTDFFSHMIYSIPQNRQRKVPVSSPGKAARAIFKIVKYKKREIIISLGGKLFSFVGVHFPRLFELILFYAVPRPKNNIE